MRLRVEFAGVVVADADRALRVVEPDGATVYYAPADDVKRQFLDPMRHSTRCPWRGTARYFTLSVRGRRSEAAAWSYAQPGAGYEELAGHIAFHPARVDACSVDETPPS